MLPGDAPPGRGAPGRGAPGRGACGRGIGRSTGCAEEKGLLPTRGVRAAGFGAGRTRTGGRSRASRSVRRAGLRLFGSLAPPVPAARLRCRGCRRLRRGGFRRRWGGSLDGGFGGASAVAGRLFRCGFSAAERFTQSTRDGRFYRRRCGFNEFALFAQPGEYFLTGNTEFLSQLVYAGLACHYISCL